MKGFNAPGQIHGREIESWKGCVEPGHLGRMPRIEVLLAKDWTGGGD
jgi:hypothetical protein